ncbi:hypothetical protein [Thermanaeromonas toyohensis]|uniref:hypothetical protein n=1 Tax=Thermanaeromonas toyohensis TaxID=161154 RepID=UPI001E31C2CB|nr:hypothetical protein [Thermanaeromonas toyohensis]
MKRIEELRREIILSGESPVAVAAGQEGYAESRVERRGTRLADSILLREMERITKAIADTYARAREEGRKVIWIKYGLAIDWEPPPEIKAQMEGRNRFDLTADQMADIASMDRATFHRYRSGFVYGIAERLGWY